MNEPAIRIRTPRVWHMPGRPSTGVKVVDRHGDVWARRPDDPDWVDLWYAGGMNPQLSVVGHRSGRTHPVSNRPHVLDTSSLPPRVRLREVWTMNHPGMSEDETVQYDIDEIDMKRQDHACPPDFEDCCCPWCPPGCPECRWDTSTCDCWTHDPDNDDVPT